MPVIRNTIASQRTSGSLRADLHDGTRSIQRACEIWLDEATMDVWKMARFLVSGVLLRKATGRLYNSIYRSVNGGALIGEVGTALPYGVEWELYGIRGPIRSNQIVGQKRDSETNAQAAVPRHRPILITKTASNKGGPMGSQIRYRQATYTRTTYKPPVRFLAKALELQMTGGNGRIRLQNLGANVGFVVAKRFVSMILGRYSPQVFVTYT